MINLSFYPANGESGESIYGLYEELLNVVDYDMDNSHLNRSQVEWVL